MHSRIRISFECLSGSALQPSRFPMFGITMQIKSTISQGYIMHIQYECVPYRNNLINALSSTN